MSNDNRTNYIIPALEPVYNAVRPLTTLLMRAMAGVAFIVHGWPKIQAPFGNIEMVQSLGFMPGHFWSPALAVVEFFGGILLLLGIFTRPVAVALSVVLLTTTYFHWVKLGQGFGGAELSLIWLTITLYFAAHGAGRFSGDQAIGRQF